MKKLILATIAALGIGAQAAPKKVLVVLSSENKITLKNGVIHPTGFFLSELMIPVEALIQAGYEPVFANPLGNDPAMDKVSDAAMWFGGQEQEHQRIKQDMLNLTALHHPHTLKEIRKQDLREYAAIFLPGGHAPMEDLLVDRDLGALLKYFHRAGKPTALICHAPIALLSTLPDAKEFTTELSNGSAAVQPWIYEGYKMTSFSTPEEQQEEPGGQDNALGGFVKFYPDQALRAAGGDVEIAPKWTSHVIRDRELITGQNPMSDVALAQALIQALAE